MSMRHFLAVAVCAVLPSLAAALPTPEAGLWQVESDTILNGRNITQDIQAMQQEMLKQLPPDQREMYAQHFDHGGSKVCLTPEQAGLMADPNRAVALLGKDMEEAGCQMGVDSVSGSRIKLKGACSPEAGQAGFKGSISGDVTYHDARHISGLYAGDGTMDVSELNAALQAGGMPSVPVDASMKSEFRFNMTWQGKDCGPVAPDDM